MKSLNFFAARRWPSPSSCFRSVASAWLVAAAVLVLITGESRATGPVLSDANLFAALNLDYPGLAAVKANVNAGNLPAAKASLAAYLRQRTNVNWYWDPRTITNNVSFNQANADAVLAYFTANPNDDAWLYQLPRGSWQNLGDTYWGTGNEQYAAGFVLQFRKYNDVHLTPTTKSSKGLDIGAAMAGGWHHWFARFLASPSFTDADVCDYLKTCIEKGRYLRTLHNDAGNWVSLEMAGLYGVGCLFPELADATEWRTYSVNNMVFHLNQYLPDGPHYELSPVYHNQTLSNYWSLVKTAELQSRSGELPTNFISSLEAPSEHFMRLMTPDRRVPQFNDCNTNMGLEGALNRAVEYFPNRADFRWANSGGSIGIPPNFTSCTYPWAGYNVMRSDWSKSANYLCFDADPLGAGHWHQDKLNVVIWAFGKRLLFDSGGGAYGGNGGNWYSYGQST